MSIKTSLLIALCALLGAFGGFSPAFAYNWTEDFDGFTTGALTGQGSWTNWGALTSGDVDGSQYQSSPYSVQFTDGEGNKITAPTTTASGTGAFYFKRTTGDSLAYFDFGLYEGVTQAIFMRWRLGGGGVNNFYINNNYIGDQTINAGWNLVEFEWDASTHKARVKTNSGAWSSWYGYGSWTGIDTFYMGCQSGSAEVCNVDTLALDLDLTPPPVAGFYPIITPTAPPDGANTTVDFDNFNLTGNVSIPTDNTYIWQKLYVYFNKSDGVESTYKEITLPDLAGGDDYDYSATSTIATATSTDVYAVSYSVWGYWCDPLYPEYCGKVGLSYPYNPAGTYISEGTNPTSGGIPLIVVDQWTPPTLENCDDPAYNFLEKTTCKIQNSLLGLVIPSADSVNKLFGTFQQFQNRFPFSYVNAVAGTLNTIRTGLNESQTIAIEVFGQTGNVSLAFWDTSTTIGGVTTTIGGVLKLILTFFVYVVFLIWGVGYLHRIL